MKIIQIAVCTDSENGECLYVLADDGCIYEKVQYLHRAGDVIDGKALVRNVYGDPWWRKVDIPFKEPPLNIQE